MDLMKEAITSGEAAQKVAIEQALAAKKTLPEAQTAGQAAKDAAVRTQGGKY